MKDNQSSGREGVSMFKIISFIKRIPIEWRKHKYGGLWYVIKLAWNKRKT